jgi:transposase
VVLGGEPAVVVWDNLNVHKSHEMRAFVAAQPWLEVAYLPPYAPELNPVEGLWANLKGQELANHACRTTAELVATAQVGSFRIRRDQQLLFGFLHHSGLAHIAEVGQRPLVRPDGGGWDVG